jgi:hypothetical protein
MPIFISYSHKNKDFVDKLAKQLVLHRVNVWLDRWELSIGDSIVEKVQEAIDESSALLVVLSKESTQSEWCKREITGAFIKELKEKRVFVLPVLIEDCKIPLFARDKLFADFRVSFDDGLQVVLEGVAKIANANLAHFESPEYQTDHGIDYNFDGAEFVINLTYIDYAKKQNYSCLTEIILVHKYPSTSDSYSEYLKDDEGALSRFNAIKALWQYISLNGPKQIRLSDEHAVVAPLQFVSDSGEQYKGFISARRLGEDTGRDILLDIDNNIERSFLHQKEVLHNNA